jgi:hypothetical protein
MQLKLRGVYMKNFKTSAMSFAIAKPQVNGRRLLAIVALAAFIWFPFSSCFGQSSDGKAINSADALKVYIDSQPANSPDKPIKVAMKANEMMLNDIVSVINKGGKYVSLNLTGSPLTTIPSGAFWDCTSLTSIIIPNSVTSIREEAFRNCTSLASVTIPNSITSIGYSAFWDCTSLTSVTFQGTISSSEFVWDVFGFSTRHAVYENELRNKFYATDPEHGTPGTYTTDKPGDWEAVWTKQ